MGRPPGHTGCQVGEPVLVRVGTLLRPAGGRVFPWLLPSVDGQVEQPVVVIHPLDATDRRPVSLEGLGGLLQVASDVIMPTRRPTKRVLSESCGAAYQGISQPMKSRYRALSSYGPWQNTAKVTSRE